jgi:hypothetical protein
MSIATAAPDDDGDAMRRQIKDLQQQVSRLAAQLSKLTGPFPRLFLAKDGDAEGQWQEQTVYDGSIVEFTQGRRSDAADHPSNLIDPSEDGAYFVQEYTDVDSGSGKLVTRFVKVSAVGMVPVTLTQTGGSNGNQTTAATWTYTANHALTGKELGTVLSPEWPRPLGAMTAAVKGVGYFDEDGDFQLAIAYEYPGALGCS